MRQPLLSAGIGLALLLAGFLFYAANKPASFQDIKETRFLLGTIVEFTITYDGDSYIALQAIEHAVQAMQHVENIFTTHGDMLNTVQRFNQAPVQQRIMLDAQVSALLTQALAINQQTLGAFDPTLGALNQLWGFSGDIAPLTPPASDKIQAALRQSGVHHVHYHGNNLWSKDTLGVVLDFGAIAKGLAIDKGIEVLQKMGIQHAIINAGGDLRILGNHVKKPWRIAIRHPRKSTPLGWFEVNNNMSIVTSGDYERFYIHENKRYHHILNPQTGKPANQSQSVTIVAHTATKADALSTAMFVLGAKKGRAIIEKMTDIEAIWLDMYGDVTMTSGMKEWFHLAKD